MKNRKSSFVVLVILLLPKASAIAQTSAPPPAPPAGTGRYVPTTIPPIPDDVYNKLSPDEQQDADDAQRIMDSENKNRVNLYGKVVDQKGQPVAGAKVRGNLSLSVSFTTSASKDYFTTTDSKGEFSFTGLQGTGFGVEPSKDGYAYNPQPTNWTKDYKPDPAHPMVFVMYKLQGAEPMVHAKVHDYIPCDGTEINYDLQTGKRAATGGGLTVKFTRNPVQIRHGKPFEWTLVMTVPGTGGLIEINDFYPYEAPADGYQKTVTITTGPNPSHYTDSASKSYYYKSDDKKYGRITITLQADFQPPPTLFNADIYTNPSGSRNLEWDETKQVKP